MCSITSILKDIFTQPDSGLWTSFFMKQVFMFVEPLFRQPVCVGWHPRKRGRKEIAKTPVPAKAWYLETTSIRAWTMCLGVALRSSEHWWCWALKEQSTTRFVGFLRKEPLAYRSTAEVSLPSSLQYLTLGLVAPGEVREMVEIVEPPNP